MPEWQPGQSGWKGKPGGSKDQPPPCNSGVGAFPLGPLPPLSPLCPFGPFWPFWPLPPFCRSFICNVGMCQSTLALPRLFASRSSCGALVRVWVRVAAEHGDGRSIIPKCGRIRMRIRWRRRGLTGGRRRAFRGGSFGGFGSSEDRWVVCGPATGASIAKPSGSGAIWGAGGVVGAFAPWVWAACSRRACLGGLCGSF